MSPWKKYLLIALGGLVALALAFSAGRFAAPAKVITKTEIQTQIVEKIVEKKVEVAAREKVVYIDRVIEKDGKIIEKIVEREVEKKTTTDKTKTDEKIATDTKTEKTTVNDYPRLTVSLLAGAQINPSMNLIPQAGPFSLGVAVSYRIAGPLQVGAFGLSTGAFGVSLGATF